MNRGYIHFWRKTWDNKVLHERSKRFSRLEAWLWIISIETRGVDDAEIGLRRGEFEASIRFLARAWRWSVGAVHGFLRELERNSMIIRLDGHCQLFAAGPDRAGADASGNRPPTGRHVHGC